MDLEQQIKLLEAAIKAETNAEKRKLLQIQKQVLKKTQSATSGKKREYHYKSEATKQAAQQRGMKLQKLKSKEEKEQTQKALTTYQQAQKVAKEDPEYKKYWEEIKRLRAEAKKLGKRLKLDNISLSPSQIKDSARSPEELARIALGLESRVDSSVLLQNAIGAGIVEEIYETSADESQSKLIGYSYEGKGYTIEEMNMMMSAPQKFFAAGSSFWNWISNEYHLGVRVSEIFGS